jgi:hypothetical protein
MWPSTELSGASHRLLSFPRKDAIFAEPKLLTGRNVHYLDLVEIAVLQFLSF